VKALKCGWIALALLPALPSACPAQTAQPTDVTIVHGACQPQSALTQAGRKTLFGCDNAIFAFYDQQNSHVMIQFAKKTDDQAPILGFADTMEKDGLTLDVDRIYLQPGKPQPAEQASCKLSFAPPHISGIACRGQVAQGAQSSAAEVVFKPDPGQ
jgi:hypothetical protein